MHDLSPQTPISQVHRGIDLERAIRSGLLWAAVGSKCVFFTHLSPDPLQCPSNACRGREQMPPGAGNTADCASHLRWEGVSCTLGLVEAIFLVQKCTELLRRGVLSGVYKAPEEQTERQGKAEAAMVSCPLWPWAAPGWTWSSPPILDPIFLHTSNISKIILAMHSIFECLLIYKFYKCATELMKAS